MTDGIDERPRSYARLPQAALAQVSVRWVSHSHHPDIVKSSTAVITHGRESAYLYLFVNNVASSSAQFLPVLGVSDLMHLGLGLDLGKDKVALRIPET